MCRLQVSGLHGGSLADWRQHGGCPEADMYILTWSLCSIRS
jgi:hypothetical protein